MLELLEFSFIQNALIAGILVSISVGIIGTLVVANRTVFIAGGIAHASYGGIGLALYFSLPFLLSSTIFSIIIAVFTALFSIKYPERTDTFIGVMWAFGMAVGIIFVDLSSGYNVDLMSYLFGSILSVPVEDLIFMGILDVVVMLLVTLFYPTLLALSFDKEYGKVRGINVTLYTILIYILIALTIVVAIRSVGLILIIALLTIPVYITESFSNSLGKTMINSSILSLVFILLGLFLSYEYNLTSGASIILVATFSFALFFTLRYFLENKN